MEEITDEKLVFKYLKGDEAALAALVRRYLPLVYGFARQYVGNENKAADIAEESFIKAWRNLKNFDRKKSFKTWIYAIAKNTAIDWLRRREEIPFSAFEAPDGSGNALELIADGIISPVRSAELSFAKQALDNALKKLPPRYGLVVSLRHDDELTFAEIARTLGEPLNTVKSRYRRAIAIVRKNLPEDPRP